MTDRDQHEVPQEIQAAMRKLSPRTRELVRAVAGAMAAHVRELHQRIAQLEARPYLNEQGVWEQNKAYGVGMVVTDHGSAWVCRRRRASDPVMAMTTGACW